MYRVYQVPVWVGKSDEGTHITREAPRCPADIQGVQQISRQAPGDLPGRLPFLRRAAKEPAIYRILKLDLLTVSEK